MNLIAIETATEACSAALWSRGDLLVRFEVAPRRHTELILPMCESLLAEAGLTPSKLDAVAFGRGPGSFTGVRIAAGTAQGIAFGCDLPVVPISTLAVLAQAAISRHGWSRVLVALDARMHEVYWGAYQSDQRGTAELLGEESVIRPERVPIPEGFGWNGVGTGWQAHGTALTTRLAAHASGFDEGLLPAAEYLVPLALSAFERGETVSAEYALPTYLRDNVAARPISL